MLFVLDLGMGYNLFQIEGDPVTHNMVEHVLKDEDRMKLFRELMTNKNVQKQYIITMLILLHHNFEANNVKDKIDELANNIRLEIPRSIIRWENIRGIWFN